MEEKLIEKLKLSGHKKGEIENVLGMPKNSLSGMMSGKKTVPEKWQKRLEDFVNGLEKAKESDPPISADPPGKYDMASRSNITEDEVAFNHPRPWIKLIENYCGITGITPEQLIEDHQKWSKPTTPKSSNKKVDSITASENPVQIRDLNEEAKPKGSGYDLRFKKLGF